MWSEVYFWARPQQKQPWSEVWRVISFRELVWMLLNLVISLQSCHCCRHCGLPEWIHLLHFWEHIYWVNCYIFTQKAVCFHMLYLPQSRSGPLPRLDRFPVRHSIACLNSRVLSTLPYSTRISATAFPFSTPNSRRRCHCRYEEYFAGSSTIVGSRSRSRVLHLIFRLRTDICISQNLTST